MLNVSNLSVSYGNFPCLKNISLEVPQGKIVSLLGANGAGKSTLMRTILGFKINIIEGDIRFLNNESLLNFSSDEIVKKGIGLVPEGREIWSNMSVEENLSLGAYTQNWSKKVLVAREEEIYQFFPLLKERRRQIAGTLSGGEQQMLAIARALMPRPKLLLLDEPSMGISPLLCEKIFELLQKLNKDFEMTILLAEQNAALSLEISHYSYILELGCISFSGLSKELLTNDDLVKAYLGVK